MLARRVWILAERQQHGGRTNMITKSFLVAAALTLVSGADGYAQAIDGAKAGTATETVLYSFTGRTGDQPTAGVARDKAGNLYGATYFGGTSGQGVVFEVAADGTESTLYNFTGGSDGGEPLYGGVIVDKNGNVYGTAQIGGADNYGVVYKVATDGTETVLYSFTDGSDGAYPSSTLVSDKTGNLYGTASDGGANGNGTVFELATNGTFTTLHSFDNSDGNHPIGSLARDKSGNLYG